MFILCTRQMPKRDFYKAKTLMTITCSAWPQFLAQSAFATYKNTGFILLTIVRWKVTCSPWSQLTNSFFKFSNSWSGNGSNPSQANFGLVWLNRNFLWCQAAPLMGFVLMNLAISSRIGLFCFGGSTRKMSDNGSDTGNFTRASWVSYAKTVP